MVKEAPDAGLYYICNPNNPTGTLTPREDIDWLVENKPANSIVLVDEAYLHFARGASACVDLAKQNKGVIVLRTFSKLYGMAGLRAGAAIGSPELLDKLTSFGPGILPATGMAGATASLRVRDLVPQRRQTLVETREATFEFLRKHGYSFLPSESNKFMLDVRTPGREAIRALAAENVYIGRVWAAMPTHVRVTVGTRDEMRRFEQALLKTVRPAA
jgi:histidinol-phosphate/aromatic aminotransferase/cobyric acid decarboxylase-like protein